MYRYKGSGFMESRPLGGQAVCPANGCTVGLNFDEPEHVDDWQKRAVRAETRPSRTRPAIANSSSASSTSLPCAIPTAMRFGSSIIPNRRSAMTLADRFDDGTYRSSIKKRLRLDQPGTGSFDTQPSGGMP